MNKRDRSTPETGREVASPRSEVLDFGADVGRALLSTRVVAGDWVVELAGLEPTTRLLWVGSAGRRISRRLVGGANSTAAKK
jgi:hypothetical protein